MRQILVVYILLDSLFVNVGNVVLPLDVYVFGVNIYLTITLLCSLFLLNLTNF